MMALQNLCINLIVREFERYYLTFYKSDDANLKRKFEFLMRMYSNQIALLLFREEDNTPEHYVNVLVNKYLKILDTDWFKECPWETVTAKFAEMGSSLENIHFNEWPDRRSWKDIIYHLSNLEIVTFYRNCNDEILKSIATFCPNIIEIDASFSPAVTDTGIKYLCTKENDKMPSTKLKRVYIEGSGVKEAGVEHLIKNLQSLEVTNYHNLPNILYNLHKNDLPAFGKVDSYNVISLNLLNLYFKSYYTDLLKICLHLCPHLKSLSCSIYAEEHLNFFSSLYELRKLYVETYSVGFNINNLFKFERKLTSLSINHCSVSVSTIVENCPCLTHLSLAEVDFQKDSDIPSVLKLFKTRTSNSTDVTNCATAQPITSVLEQIIFNRCNVLSNEYKADILICCEHCPIKKICFSHSVLEMSFLKDILVNCYSLTYLRLNYCLLSRDEQDELQKFAALLPNKPKIDFSDEFSDISDDDSDHIDYYHEFDHEYDHRYYFNARIMANNLYSVNNFFQNFIPNLYFIGDSDDDDSDDEF